MSVEINEVEDLEAIPEVEGSRIDEPPKRKRGRPPGSKNKPKDPGATAQASAPKPDSKVKVDLPPEVAAMFARMPLMLAGSVAAKRGVILRFDEESLRQVDATFNAWLKSVDLELTPGWALIGAYSMAMVSGVANAERVAQSASEDGQPGSGKVDPAPNV